MAGTPLKLSPKVFDQRHGTVLDSGTTYAYLPEEAFLAFKSAVSCHALVLSPLCFITFEVKFIFLNSKIKEKDGIECVEGSIFFLMF